MGEPLGSRQGRVDGSAVSARKWWLVVDPKDGLTHEVFDEEGAAAHWAGGVGCAVVEVVRTDAYSGIAREAEHLRSAIRDVIHDLRAGTHPDDARESLEAALDSDLGGR